MGGKGQRRREKNYRAAHGGESHLPPPPKLEELDAIPFKLRKLMELKSPSSSSANKGPKVRSNLAGKESKKGGAPGEKEGKISRLNTTTGDTIPSVTVHKGKKHDETINDRIMNGDRKRKRKRKEVKDLRFQPLDQDASLSKKKRRMEFLDAKRKKKKKAKTDNVPDFPGHETVKFGDVVQAPPKLSVPKALKNVYQERVRLDAIEAYRKHKGWASRPGVKIPMPEDPPN